MVEAESFRVSGPCHQYISIGVWARVDSITKYSVETKGENSGIGYFSYRIETTAFPVSENIFCFGKGIFVFYISANDQDGIIGEIIFVFDDHHFFRRGGIDHFMNTNGDFFG